MKRNGTTGKAYWRSLDELARTPEFRAFVENEFPSHAAGLLDGPSRRQFLKIMGASFALAGLSGMCAAGALGLSARSTSNSVRVTSQPSPIALAAMSA